MVLPKKTSPEQAGGPDRSPDGKVQLKEGSSDNFQSAQGHVNPSAPEDANTTPGMTGSK